ncbi:VOC family protein [Amycolatopsis deserti]|uniref:VOC family protein n=1 Tax=Amycolatopsis deserti TaxID=185696 RepID=UPI0017481E54|nr:VOC family protein [Amycolatopsis deserti]
MEQSVQIITVSTLDLDAARAFYVDGLGWRPLLDVPGEILFFEVAHGVALGLFDAAKFAEDLNTTDVTGPAGLTLSHNLPSPDEVDRCLDAAERAGAEILKPGQRAAFGGYHGHFRDPIGLIWEIAHNPGWAVDPDGTVRIGLIDA